MREFNEIQKLWLAWRNIPFPSQLAGEEVAGICVTSLDTFIAGSVDKFISQQGKLNEQNQRFLEDSKKKLEVVIENLKDANKLYFEKLLQITGKILETQK